MLGNRHPFFAPVWRRVITVALTGGWAVLETAWGNSAWAFGFGALAAYCFYEFFVIFDPKNYEDPDG